MYCLKVPFLRTVKHNNFLPYDISLYNCGHEKSQCYPEKERISPEKDECGPEKDLLWRRGRKVLLLLLLLLLLLKWCSKISVTKKSEEIRVKISIRI